MKNRKWPGAVIVGILVVVMITTAGLVSARYMESIQDFFGISIKPYHGVSFQHQEWQQQDDGCIFSFQLAQSTRDCRVYLAVSEGVAKAELLDIRLMLSDNTILQAQAEKIAEDSQLHRVFGAGYVFRFRDAQTGEEILMDFSTEVQTLHISGIDGATVQTSLLRVFVEN